MKARRVKFMIVPWEEALSLCKKLAMLIIDDSYYPDVIVTIARGGFIPARIVADFLDVREMYSITLKSWGTIERHGPPKVVQPLNVSLKDKRVLIVDEVVDTGESMEVAFKHVKEIGKPKEIKTAVLHYKTRSKHIPNYYVIKVEEWKWIVYPWSIHEDIRDLLRRLGDLRSFSVETAIKALREKYSLTVPKESIKESLMMYKIKNFK
ncbi:MAG: phosphoribosyltransferase [Thermoprotei archaeon]|nr:phosphoribosyltransferase [Thermoprotei archaeon]